jgi:hypothetical protein
MYGSIYRRHSLASRRYPRYEHELSLAGIEHNLTEVVGSNAKTKLGQAYSWQLHRLVNQ